jgi:hypothetical protein
MVNVSQQCTLVESLSARRHVDGRVLRKEVDGLEADFKHLARHHGEVFDAWNLRRECKISQSYQKKTDSTACVVSCLLRLT